MKSLIAILIFLSAILFGCTEKLMVVKTTKHRLGTEIIMPFDRKFKRMLKDSSDVEVMVIRSNRLK